MPIREPARPSPKLLALLKDFQQIASMAGYLNHVMDPPQLRLMFTLYGRVAVATEEEGLACLPELTRWCDRVGLDLREGSSAAILPPQVQIGAPQALPAGGTFLVATLTFNTKVTDSSYLRVRGAILRAYKRAVALRETGLEAALARMDEAPEEEGGPEGEA